MLRKGLAAWRQARTDLAWAKARLSMRARARRQKREALDPRVHGDPPFKVNIGCGNLALPGFINVDARAMPHVHITSDVACISELPDAVAEVVYASHILEHFSHLRVREVLWEWMRLLRPGGQLYVAVPDFAFLAKAYVEGEPLQQLESALMGGQTYEGNTHLAAFDRPKLEALLRAAGASDVEIYDPRTLLPAGYQDTSLLPCSLNLRATKAT
jgi:SAM-dependent methyltransferase